MAVPTYEELSRTIDVAQWDLLRAHLERGGLIIVAADLDLAETGVKIAGDDAAAVGQWISAGKLSKPSAEDIATWDAAPGTTFRILITSPYVLVQRLQ